MKRKITGFTLIELMVGLLLSSVFMLGMTEILSQTRRNFRIQNALSNIMEDGRYTQDIVGTEIRRTSFLRNRLIAGGDKETIFAPTDVNVSGGVYSIAEGTSTSTGSFITLDMGQSISGVDGGTNSDSFIIRYQVNDALEISSGLSPCTRGLALDGTTDDDPNTQRHVISILFYVDSDNELECIARRDNLDDSSKNKTSAAEPLISNVERIRVLYGESDGASKRAYKTVTQIDNWSNVESMRLSIVLFSEQENLALENALTPYTVNGQKEYTLTAAIAAEKRLYRTFSVTVDFRNGGL